MKRIVEAEKEYRRFHGQKAIDKFFESNKALSYWKETFEWMLETGEDFFSDDTMADGTYNADWCYAIHFKDDEYYTYICVIERA